MRYLKTFESKTEDLRWKRKEDIKKFCEDNLAYLIDSKFKVDIDDINNTYRIKILTPHALFGYGRGPLPSASEEEHISYRQYYNQSRWDSIKYDFIPFLEELNKKYEILPSEVVYKGRRNYNSSGDIIFNIARSGYASFCFDKEIILNDTVLVDYYKRLTSLGLANDESDKNPIFLSIEIKIR